MLSILIPAAGQSTRMRGADKLMEEVDGTPCLRLLAERAVKVTEQVFITLPDTNHPRAATLSDVPVTLIPVPDAATGMSASLKTGIAQLPQNTKAALILPADMPEITAHDMAQLWAVFQASGLTILQAATDDGTPGHPVLFDRRHFAEFSALSGDKGAAQLIAKHSKTHGLLPLPGTRARLDLDTPEDWLEWRKKTR